uniref:Leucine-rich repeat and IQ domain-containing protein 1 n=1 Tax=Calidris pygmaea TaxID=425635 RepID=A0A8C3J7A5_9CHAR
SRMSEDIEGIEKEIEIELSRISVSSLEADDPDTEVSEALSDSERISDDLPESVLSYLNFIKSRNQDAEKLILQDLEDEETTSKEGSQLKYLCTSYSDAEMSISLTHCEIEEKCRRELEQWEKRQKDLEDEKREKWKAEREAQEKQNEEEHARRVQRLEEFEAERIKLELLHKKQQTVMEDGLQKEKKAWRDKIMQRKELIMKLQLQMEEEKKALEEQKAEERQHLAEQQNTAAVKIQARFRSFLVHKKYAPILKEWKDEIKKKQKILEEIEKEMKEKEEKRNRQMEEKRQKKEEEKKIQEEFERQEYLEQLRRHEEYEKKKASLKLEKQLQIRREQRKIGEKRAKAVMSESGENNKEDIKKDKQTENIKVMRDQKKELNKQVKEQKEKQTEMMHETNYWMIPAERNLTPPNMLGSEKREHSSQVNNKNVYINSVTHVEENYSQTKDLNKAQNNNSSRDESVSFGANDMVENKTNNICSSSLNVQPNASNREVKDQFSQSETMEKAVFLMESANEEVRESWDRIQDLAECSSRLMLPDDIEKKRINWMNTCKPWSKIYEENQRKQATIKKRPRKSSVSKMPSLSTQEIINSGPWNTLQQVTTLTLEDLPACSLSTLSECTNLQVLTLRRCGLAALEGLSSCKDLKYINVEENNIQIIDCENLENLRVLILNKNHLSSVCGLDGCVNLQNLELSYNRITRIGGLESLKNLQQLIVDHNQLISTKGLCEAPSLIHLDCSFNHLTQVEGIENCGLLQILKLQGNNLQEVPRLENHVLLRELYLDDNSISAMRMISLYWLPLLQTLLLSQNRLTELVPLNSFVSLEKLDIKNNCLSDLKGIITWLSGCHKLRELSLSGNPLLQERNWRPSLCMILPSLQFLDGEILNYQALPTTERIKGSELRTFLELCQVQIEENALLKKKAAELGYAFWKGFLLRKKLASALAAVKSDEVDDDFEEINVDDFIFSEAALEKEWLTLDSTRFPSKTLLLSNQLHWPKVTCHRNFLLFSLFSFLKDMLLWGFKDISTAQLMLKRAHKMKPKKYSNKKLGKSTVKKCVSLLKSLLAHNIDLNIGEYLFSSPGKKEEFSQLDTTLDEKFQRRKDFTYQWLHTQLLDYEAASSKNIKCGRFLPELDPVVRDSRRVQLVASPVSREDTDLDLVSMASGSALTENREKNKQPHRHSARSSSKLWVFSILVLKITFKC